MKKLIIFLFLSYSLCFGAVAQSQIWESGYTFFAFFQKYGIPTSVYYNLSPGDRELTSEIYAGVRYYTLIDDEGKLLQALIPIGDGMQIHIFKRDGQYMLDFTPMIYFEQEQVVNVTVQKSPYQDLLDATNDKGLVAEFLNAYKNSVSFRNMMKHDRLAIVYNRKYRLGQPLKNASIKAAVVEVNKKPHFVFGFDGRYYDKSGKEVHGFMFRLPVAGARVSSRFSLGRKHPILGTIRPHYGVDLAAPMGTAIVAPADGVVTFAGKRGGYGNLVEIRHENNLRSLYGHMHSFATGIKPGRKVKQGQMIGRVGSTGLSTGPHVHFGLYRNNQPINPLSNIKMTSKELQGKNKEEFNALVQHFIPRLNQAMDEINNMVVPDGGFVLPQDSQALSSDTESNAI